MCQDYIITKYCPECNTELQVRYDYLKMETTCKYCGLVLHAPPEYGIIYPEIITKFVKKGSPDDSG